jgi:hypothetical protein
MYTTGAGSIMYISVRTHKNHGMPNCSVTGVQVHVRYEAKTIAVANDTGAQGGENEQKLIFIHVGDEAMEMSEYAEHQYYDKRTLLVSLSVSSWTMAAIRSYFEFSLPFVSNYVDSISESNSNTNINLPCQIVELVHASTP